jgi:hypothetical protein
VLTHFGLSAFYLGDILATYSLIELSKQLISFRLTLIFGSQFKLLCISAIHLFLFMPARGMFKAEFLSNNIRRLSIQSLKNRLAKRYYNEVKIKSEMIDGQYSREEIDELQQYMINHPYVKFADQLCKKAQYIAKRAMFLFYYEPANELKRL